MPYAPEHKQRSRERVLKSAVKCFTARGYDNTSIDDIMNDAGMTRGAFYAHFKDKSSLYAEAVFHAATNSRLKQAKPPSLSDIEWLMRLAKGYLSRRHVKGGERPCPLAFLATDVVNREDQVREAYTRVYKNFVTFIAEHLSAESTKMQRNNAMVISALLIGGVAISRALDDENTVDRLLDSCRDMVHQLLSKDEGGI